MRSGLNTRSTFRFKARMTPMRAIIVGPPLLSATRIKTSTAVCHSSICCSAFGSFWIYLAASSRVTSWRPRGSGIGSSNLRVQPRSLMTPPLLVELGSKALRRSWRHVLVTWIAPRTRSRRQRHRCRRARLPKVYPGALRKPNPCPRSVSTSFTRHFCHESLLQPI